MRFTCILLLLWMPLLYAQHDPVTLPGTERRSLHSDIVGQDYELYIKFPWNYGKSDTTYPVLFTTDANRNFPVYSTLSLIYETPTFRNDEIIVVGIAYRLSPDRLRGLAEWAVLRSRDLQPERSVESEQFWRDTLTPLVGQDFEIPSSGKGAEFLKFIQLELIPFVEANYRVSSNDRGIAGYSLGGLFTLYALFHAPEIFTRYFAGSPSLIERCIDYEAAFAADHSDLTAKILLTANDAETTTREGIRRLAENLQARAYPGLTVDTCIFRDESHASGGATAISRALRTLYYDK